MSRVFLAAGVAALAIAAPLAAKPGGGGGGGGGGGRGGGAAFVQRGGGGAARMQAPRMQAPRIQAAPRQQRFATSARPQRAERIQMRAQRPARLERVQMRAQRPARVDRVSTRVADRQQVRANRAQQVQNRALERQNRLTNQQQLRVDRVAQGQNRILERQQLRAGRVGTAQLNGQGYGVGGCPPGLAKKAVACVPPGQAAKLGLTPVITANNAAALRAAQLGGLNRTYGTRLLAPAAAASLLGMPLAQATGVVPLAPLPQSLSYLYPSTPNYTYQYGGGYLYQVDRTSSLISALIPLLAGGLMPGQYLPQPYMSSYVPSYYGLNSFYPSSYSAGYGYGSPYSNLCNRYANGVIYRVDCMTGMIVDVIPMYAGGYGVGQMLPSAYSAYNVPYQYRSMYYNTANTGYYYAPGAIYQYDPSSSMITSVAALLSPGFSVGQPLPMGYSTYNVPYGYRQTYYDTPNAWYRYNNGYIYQVNPATQLVTAIVASLLT
ncbi:MAG: hypothetical protein V4502_01545 [Pseudomonadota bacterium]